MIQLVIGGQYGSEGKGGVVSWLAQNFNYDLIIRTGAPNAGHGFLKPDGEKIIMRQLPCTWPFQDVPIYLPSGCVIDEKVLKNETKMLKDFGYKSPITISPFASVIEKDAITIEKQIKTGTTRKGIGATRAKKCLRSAKLFPSKSDITLDILNDPKSKILIESTQGFGLSLNYKHYPYCTSTDIMPYQILQDADTPFGVHDIEVWMVIRTFPIRIAGNSGYLFNETSWENLQQKYGNHIPVEYTSVTKKVRRVGEFDVSLVKDAIQRCNPSKIVLTFVDYLFTNRNQIDDDIFKYVNTIKTKIDKDIDYVSLGCGNLLKL